MKIRTAMAGDLKELARIEALFFPESDSSSAEAMIIRLDD